MRIFEAYDDPAIRILFKNYIEAEGISVGRREQTYKRFGTYMSRIRGVLFDRMLLDAPNEAAFREKLDFIFYDKWKNHLGYPEIPDYFYRYLDFLHTLCAINDDISIDGLAPDDCATSAGGNLSRHEERFVSTERKLRIISNPSLIRALKARGLWATPAGDDAADFCSSFYDGCQLSMARDDWKLLIDNELKPKRNSKKRGELSFEIRQDGGEPKIYNSTQAMELIVNLAGIDRVGRCNLKLNGQPVIVRRIPNGKEATFKDLGGGFFLNNMGTVMDRFKAMRALVSLLRLPLEINLSKETAVKTRPQTRKPRTSPATPMPPKAPESPEPLEQPKAKAQPEMPKTKEPEPEAADDFVYGYNGTLNLFDDL